MCNEFAAQKSSSLWGPNYLCFNWTKHGRCCFLASPFKIELCGYLTKKIHFYSIKKNPHDWILRGECKEQHLSTVPKSYPFLLRWLPNLYVKSFRISNYFTTFLSQIWCGKLWNHYLHTWTQIFFSLITFTKLWLWQKVVKNFVILNFFFLLVNYFLFLCWLLHLINMDCSIV